MSAVADAVDLRGARERTEPVPRSRMAVAVTADLAKLEAEWRAFEARAAVTPYQSFGWIAAFAAGVGAAEGMQFRFATVRDGAGDLVALLPLVITRRLGVRFAEFIGGKHANYHMGLFDPAFAATLDAAAVRALMAEIGAGIGGIDAFLFVNQPPDWNGVVNPLVHLAAGPSPSRAYRLALEPGDCEGTLRRSMSSHARKKLKNKRNRFAEFGESRLIRAAGAAEVDWMLDAFMSQKAARFAAMGLPDPFRARGVRAFLRRGALADPAPAIELFALEVAGRPVSIYVGAVQGSRFSGMATSFDSSGPMARTSPGEIMLVDLIKLKCREGYAVFDLGVGEARYKTTICDGHDDLVDGFLALNARGHAFAAYSQLKRAVKARIKRSPAALMLAHRASGWLGRRRETAEE